MLCPNCGTENENTANYCTKCGRSLRRKARVAGLLARTPWLVGIVALAILAGIVVAIVVAGVLIWRGPGQELLAGGKKLPRELRQLVFEDSDFAEPIAIGLAGGDDPETYEKYRTQKLDHAPAAAHPGWASAKGSGFLEFLVSNGYAEVKTVKAQAYLGPAVESRFFFYNGSIEPYILSGSCRTDSHFTLLLARRKRKVVSFTNEYEQLGEKFYAVKFIYTLEGALPGLLDIERDFEGKAELWWDPSEGAWTLLGLELEDRDYLEYHSPRPQMIPEESGKSFSGTWQCAELTMEMSQDGNRVVGRYEFLAATTRFYGYIEGEVDGNRLNAKWWVGPAQGITYAEVRERGDAYFVLAGDGNSMSWNARNENQQEWMTVTTCYR